MKFFKTILSLLIPVAASAEIPSMPGNWSDGYAYVNGVRIHYYHATPASQKPVIVMVHGVTDNGLCWSTLTWKLEENYDIYMLDARGHGLSDPFSDNDDRDTLIKDVVDFVHVMGLEKPILMGHSMGAATVMRIGAEYPDLAKAIIMLDPFVGQFHGNLPPPPPSAASTDPLAFNMIDEPVNLAKQNNYSYDALVQRARQSDPKWNLADCQYWALSKIQYHGPYTEKQWKAMHGTMNIGNALAEISAPALILKADAPAEERQKQLEAAKVMQYGKLVHIDGARHNLHHDELAETTKYIREFLNTLDD